jgi:hypothetical protein
MTNTNTQPNPDPLAKLFINGEDSNREIAAFLVNYVRVDPESLDVYFVDADMRIRHKIPLYLLSMHLMKRVGKRKTDTARSVEIARGLHADGNTVRPMIKFLLEDRVIERDKRGLYFVRSSNIKSLKSLLEGK